jgi:putative ABC transport system permease protein
VFIRILRGSFLRQRRRKAIVLTAVTLGTGAASALADIALDVGDKLNEELRGFGANLVVLPRGGEAPAMVAGEDVTELRVRSLLDGGAVHKVKDNFWKNNILAVAPILDVSALASGRRVLVRGTWFERTVTPNPAEPDEQFVTGIRALNPYWSVEGRWPDDRSLPGPAGSSEALLGRSLAGVLGVRPGDTVELYAGGRTEALTVAGILTTGDREDDALLTTIETTWRLSGVTAVAAEVHVRALTTPESAIYERMGKSPKDLSPEEFEKWSCTPFVSSIAYEIERALPESEARIVRRVAASEGRILHRTSGLMLLIALLAATGSALTVTSALTTSVLERRSEIGLLKAMGAGTARVAGLFLAEAAAIGLLGGLLGAGAGALMARWISSSVFGAPVTIRPVALPLAVVGALAITVLGSILPVRRIVRLRPIEVLRGL